MSEQALEQLRQALADLPSRVPTELVGEQLHALAQAARDHGHSDEVTELLRGAMEGAPEATRGLLAVIDLRENDVEFRDFLPAGLRMQRVVFDDLPVQVADQSVRLEATRSGALLPRLLDPKERSLLTVACSAQILVENDLPDERAEQLHRRGFDYFELSGSLVIQYQTRTMRRVAWGTAMVMFTDRRAIVLITDDDPPSGQVSERSDERWAMPVAFVDSNSWSMVLLASIEADQFEDAEIGTGFLQRRMPAANLDGACSLALDTYRVVQGGELVKPPAGLVADTIRGFVGA